MNTQTIKLPRLAILGFAIIGLSVSRSDAQLAANSDAEVVQLDRFVVSTAKDNGYTAVDSLSGGRQASPVRVTPGSISSMTRQFVDDLNITDVQNALRWSLNAQP